MSPRSCRLGNFSPCLPSFMQNTKTVPQLGGQAGSTPRVLARAALCMACVGNPTKWAELGHRDHFPQPLCRIPAARSPRAGASRCRQSVHPGGWGGRCPPVSPWHRDEKRGSARLPPGRSELRAGCCVRRGREVLSLRHSHPEPSLLLLGEEIQCLEGKATSISSAD